MSILGKTLFADSWNMGHVIYHLSNHGEIPKANVLKTVRLLEELMADAALARHYQDAHYASKRMHEAVRIALTNNDSLRATTLIIDWQQEYDNVP